MNPDDLKKFHEVKRDFEFVVNSLQSLHRRLDGIVHDNVTEQVNMLAEAAEEATTKLDEAIGSSVTDALHRAQREVAETLSTILSTVVDEPAKTT